MFRRLAALRVALRAAFLRTRVERELDEEIRYHLDREIEEARKAYESAVARARPGSKEDDSAIALMKGMIAEAERKGFRSPQGPSQNAK